ncbi:MAG: VanZ family protein, partial [bacterium]
MRWPITAPIIPRLGLLGALLFILGTTLAPMDVGSDPDFVACFLCGARSSADALVNMILFAPLGLALALIGRKGIRWIGHAAALSTTIEFAQLVIPGRDPSLSDVCFNTVGAAIGQLVARVGSRSLASTERTAARLCLVASVATVLVYGLTARLLAPSFPDSPYQVWWTPKLHQLEWYHARGLHVTLGSVTLRAGEISQPLEVRRLLRAGAPLHIEAIAGPRVRALGPLLVIADNRQREVLLIGPDRDDLVLRYRTRASQWRLDQPDVRLRGVLARVARGDTLVIEASRSTSGTCLMLNGTGTCRLGYTIGSGWALLLFPEHFPPWLQQLLGAAWVGAFLIPVGMLSRRQPETLLATGILIAGLFVLPGRGGLLPTPPLQLLGAGAGWLLGAAL